ncbi:hypothetical protein [Promicromonospora kroppenstedtii]|uniref:hypothetical protein n=1 Tax=Promicromonospora kroppenstedtii TaxID=440482 RepID=UPI0004B79153|nr:hypothetical protein [Promicromonospora kroppenstedtii]
MPAQVPSAAIDEAVTDAIAEAQSDADAAQLTADGKNTITYGSAAPTSTTPGRPGDIFWVRSGSTITAQYLCTVGTGRAHGQHLGRSDAHQRDHLDARRREGHYGHTLRCPHRAKSMTLDKLLIASTENLLINPDFGIGTGAPAGWSGGNSTVVSVTDGPDAVTTNVLRVTPLLADQGTTNDAYKLTASGTTVEHGAELPVYDAGSSRVRHRRASPYPRGTLPRRLGQLLADRDRGPRRRRRRCRRVGDPNGHPHRADNVRQAVCLDPHVGRRGFRVRGRRRQHATHG